jgi:hypothetical protein
MFARRLLKITGLLVLSVVVLSVFSVVSAEEILRPFKPGEEMHYTLRWGAIPAGEATLEVRDMKKVQGVDAYHFVMTARSNSFVDIFFKVRDRIDSYADADLNHSLFFKKNQLEGKTRRYIQINFDWEKNESSYKNFDSEPKIISQIPGSFDPLSVFYFSRTLDLQEGKEFEQPVTDGKRNMMGVLRVTGKERISVPAGTFDTLLLEPDLKKVEGVFSKKLKAKIKLWVTDDRNRMLVKMKSKVKIGSFVAELDSYKGVELTMTSKLHE